MGSIRESQTRASHLCTLPPSPLGEALSDPLTTSMMMVLTLVATVPLTASPFVATLGLSALAALAIVRMPRTRRARTGAARRCTVVETLAVAGPRLARDACAATAHARVDRDACTTGRTTATRERTAISRTLPAL